MIPYSPGVRYLVYTGSNKNVIALDPNDPIAKRNEFFASFLNWLIQKNQSLLTIGSIDLDLFTNFFHEIFETISCVYVSNFILLSK